MSKAATDLGASALRTALSLTVREGKIVMQAGEGEDNGKSSPAVKSQAT